MKKLVLIDGNAILHRAYHAYPPLTNPKGVVINAVHGFFSMFFSILTDQKPDFIAVCFDRAAPNFRQTLFAGYQQHRPQIADDFIPQFGIVHKILEKMKVGVFELDGYEADDLIGTLATKAVQGKEKADVVVVTGDRDMLQLVNSHVKVLMPLTGLSKTVLFDEKAVEAKYEVKPSQFVDYKALIGDASDGYPGVSGIGPKTASKLITEYGTFENLYKKVGDLPEKIGLKLATDAEQAALAKKLAAIVCDVPVQFDLKTCAVSGFDIAGLRKGFEEQGFNTLQKRADGIFGVAVEKHKEEEKKADDQLELL